MPRLLTKTIFVVLALLAVGAALFTRFYHLGVQPAAIHIDEPSFALEAQALYETGRDTWGEPWPIVFKAYGEYKAPGLIYATLPFVALTGHVNSFVSRLPTALTGFLSLITFVAIIATLYPKQRNPLFLLASFLILAFSPWHFDTSRLYLETIGGLFFFSLGILALLRSTTHPSTKLAILAGSFFALAGYWYSSYRYVTVIILVLYFILYHRLSARTLRLAGLIFLSLTIVGFGWVKLFGRSESLRRYDQLSSNAKYAQSLAINDKRQYCYLSVPDSPFVNRFCYAIWNKPVMRFNNVSTILLSYLSPEILFFKSGIEYGIDGNYGAFLWPLLPLYLLGWLRVGQAVLKLIKTGLTNLDLTSRHHLFLGMLTCIGFLPNALTEEFMLHRTILGLWGASLLIVMGLAYALTLLRRLPTIAKTITYGLFAILVLFFIVQSQAHYFFVYTHNNDDLNRYDLTEIYNFIVPVASQYDLIIDRTFNGPLDAAFFGLVTPLELQQSKRSEPREDGWSFVLEAGKVKRDSTDLVDLLCSRQAGKLGRTLVITDPQTYPYSQYSVYQAKSWNQVHLLHEVYDLDLLLEHQEVTKTTVCE